jgi:uncharacterized protein YceK
MVGRLIFLLSCSFALSGCGTLMTLANPDQRVSWGLKRTHCKQIPYVYSGVVYNFCRLNGEAKTDPDGVPLKTDPVLFMFVGADILMSGTLDTLALPYTLHRQSNGDYIVIGD